MLGYDYIKNHRPVAVNISGQKELYGDSREIQQTEFDGQLKLLMVLTILEKIKKTRLRFSQGDATVL